MIVYRLRDGSYLLAKIGRSQIAHRPDCHRVTRWMVSWLEAREEGRVRRHPCVECMPLVGDDMDPHTILETTRYTALVADTPGDLVEALLRGRPGFPVQDPRRLSTLIQRVVNSLRDTDPGFADTWNRLTTMT